MNIRPYIATLLLGAAVAGGVLYERHQAEEQSREHAMRRMGHQLLMVTPYDSQWKLDSAAIYHGKKEAACEATDRQLGRWYRAELKKDGWRHVTFDIVGIPRTVDSATAEEMIHRKDALDSLFATRSAMIDACCD